ncbi:MAG: N-acetylmuramoyl-L-alanine amidase [Alphaproteobacteria bacterium]|nr:N-acetylmuramoyl-L-alanine amidase [Alphaproteobacteria bacterium]
MLNNSINFTKSLTYLRKYVVFLLLMCFSLVLSYANLKQTTNSSSIKKIIIDPGHGGSDGGARGKYSNEKDIALAISLKLANFLRKNLPDVEIILTRETDVFHTVGQKAKFANAQKGDLFISIHTNSASGGLLKTFIGYETKTYYVKKGKNKIKKTKKVRKYKYTHLPSNAQGTETYIYNVNKSEQRLEAANEITEDYTEDLDSASIAEIDAMTEKLENDPSQKILARLLTQDFFEKSAALALTIEEEFKKAGRLSRDARQRDKGIWVLQAVTMPAVLIETGFISNKEEEDYLNSEEGQNQLCEAITKAIIRYKNTLDK